MTPVSPPRHATWGWTDHAQRFLASLVIAGAIGLLATNQAEPVATANDGIPTLRLDPNTATPELLSALPQLGPARSGAIVTTRETRPFTSPEDLERRVRGIGPVTLERIRPYLRFDQDPQAAGAATSPDP